MAGANDETTTPMSIAGLRHGWVPANAVFT
jgi:hypothetical protein